MLEQPAAKRELRSLSNERIKAPSLCATLSRALDYLEFYCVF
jgi:hypothetical protein